MRRITGLPRSTRRCSRRRSARFRLELISGGDGPRSPAGANFGEHLSVRGANHLCFRVEDVDAAVASIEDKGVEPFVPPTDYPVGAERRIAFFKDVEGNVIELAGPLHGA